MLFLYILSFLYLTQRVSSQVTSESEVINKIIKDILLQADKKNEEKQNDENENADKTLFWNDIIVQKQRAAQRNNLRNSNKRKLQQNAVLRMEKPNPTLKLHDILPELLNNAYTNPSRVSRRFNSKKTTTKPTKTTTKTQSKTAINQSSKTNAENDRKTTNLVTKDEVTKTTQKTTQKTRNLAITNDVTKSHTTKKPTLDIYGKNIPSEPQEHQFSKSIFQTPKVSTTKESSLSDKMTTEQQKTSSTESTSQLSYSKDSYDSGIYNNPKQVKSSKFHFAKTGTKQYPFTTITEKEWSSLKEAEDFVNSIPEFKTTPTDYLKTTTHDITKFKFQKTDNPFQFREFNDNGIDVYEKYTTTKQMDKRVTEDIIEKLKHFTIGTTHKNSDGTVVDAVTAKETDKLNKEVKANKENPMEFTIRSTTMSSKTKNQGIDAFKKKTTAKETGEKVTEDERLAFVTTTRTLKYKIFDITAKPDEPVALHPKQDPIQNENIDNVEESLDEILRKISAKKTTETFKNVDVEFETTEKNDFSISPYDDPISGSTIDQYLLASPKDTPVTSYYTLETTTDNMYDKLLSDLGIETKHENAVQVPENMVEDEFHEVPFSSTVAASSDAVKKNYISELYKDVTGKYETTKDDHANFKPDLMRENIKKRVNWQRIKNFFGHERVCKCTCKANKTMCKVCAAGDSVMRELVFEFNNLADYMNSHCTEIQTFFWMNPSGGKRLRDAVHKIDNTMQDYYKRVKGKCAGRSCQAFSTYLDRRRNSDKMKLRKKLLDELLRDLEVK